MQAPGQNHAVYNHATTYRAEALIGKDCCIGVFSAVMSISCTESPPPCDFESETELPSVDTSCTNTCMKIRNKCLHNQSK